MSAQGAAGAGDAAQNTSNAEAEGQQGAVSSAEQQTPPPNAEPQQQPAQPQQAQEAPFGTRLGAVLEEMDLPDDVRQQVMPKPKKPAEPAKGGTPASPEPTPAQPTAQQQPAQPAPTAAADEDHPVPEEWPDSAKQRVAEESGKRRKRTEELEAVKRENAELKAKAAQPQAQQQSQPARPRPSETDPLADVTNEQELAAAVREYDQLYEWAELNRDGIADVLLGKDANGNEIRHDYTPEEMARIRIKCQRILNRDIPARHSYLEQQRAVEQEARQARPELFDSQSPVFQEAQLIVQQLPEIRRFPDWQLWIADAIAGRNARLEAAQAASNNGNNNPQRQPPNSQRQAPVNPTVQAFLRPQPPIAPTPPSVRGGAPLTHANDVDVNKAKEELIESGGTDEAMEAFIAKSRQAQQANRPGGRTPALV